MPDARIGYVLKRFPRFSETFILNELLAHEAAGAEVHVFSLLEPAGGAASCASGRAPGRGHRALAHRQGDGGDGRRRRRGTLLRQVPGPDRNAPGQGRARRPAGAQARDHASPRPFRLGRDHGRLPRGAGDRRDLFLHRACPGHLPHLRLARSRQGHAPRQVARGRLCGDGVRLQRAPPHRHLPRGHDRSALQRDRPRSIPARLFRGPEARTVSSRSAASFPRRASAFCWRRRVF